MKKTINKKRYDTETANEIASFQDGSLSNSNYICETLYRTQKGAWFLLGEGGANTKYANSTIIPFSSIEAFDWFEENDKNDEKIGRYKHFVSKIEGV